MDKEEDLKNLKEGCKKIEKKYEEIEKIELKIKYKTGEEWSWHKWYLQRKSI